jgi:hypothetical protein
MNSSSSPSQQLDALLEKFQGKRLSQGERVSLMSKLRSIRDSGEGVDQLKGTRIAAAIILRYLEIEESI